RLGVRGDLVVVRAEPRVEAGGVLGAEDENLVLADGELRLDLHAAERSEADPLASPAAAGADAREVARAGISAAVRARILLPVLDEPRRAELVDLREDVLRERLHVLLLEHDGHRNDHREVLRGTAVVV